MEPESAVELFLFNVLRGTRRKHTPGPQEPTGTHRFCCSADLRSVSALSGFCVFCLYLDLFFLSLCQFCVSFE